MLDKYELVAGLEVHCQLAAATKLFCRCSTASFGASANSFVCQVCTGQPGVLPVLNRGAVELAFKAALAFGAEIAPASVFARKNYFYPDLPKAYQISQFELPFSQGGAVELVLKDGETRRVPLTRIHLEEDAGKLIHTMGSQQMDCSLVDFNRSGIALIEIVGQPEIRSSEEAYAYLTSLKQTIQFAGVSRCDMEKGELRCDANVSVRRKGEAKLGTRAEIKNLNSFRAVRDAVDYEFRRQTALIEQGGRVVQETRLWDAAQMETRAMRSKEEAHDYRYFPDPDLVPLEASPVWIARLKGELPEAPAVRRARFSSQYGLSAYDAEVLVSDRALADYFEAAAGGRGAASAKTVANLMTTELLGRLNADGKGLAEAPIRAADLGGLVDLLEKGTISSKLAKDLLSKMWETGKPAAVLVSELGLAQVSDDGQVRDWVRQALAANPQAAADLKGGKDRAIGSIVGAVMKLSKGKANPGLVNKLIKEEVSK